MQQGCVEETLQGKARKSLDLVVSGRSCGWVPNDWSRYRAYSGRRAKVVQKLSGRFMNFRKLTPNERLRGEPPRWEGRCETGTLYFYPPLSLPHVISDITPLLPFLQPHSLHPLGTSSHSLSQSLSRLVTPAFLSSCLGHRDRHERRTAMSQADGKTAAATPSANQSLNFSVCSCSSMSCLTLSQG